MRGASEEEKALTVKIGRRFVALQREFGVENPYRPVAVAARVLGWHRHHEALALEKLLEAKNSDFTHDVGGIMRGDATMSARYALIYHKEKTDVKPT